VTHRVRSELADSRLPCGFLEGQPYVRVGNGQATELSRTRKNPVTIPGKLRCLPPGFQNREHLRVYGHHPAGVDGFYVIHFLPDNAALHAKLAAEPIDITPLQAKAFTNPQSEADAHQAQ